MVPRTNFGVFEINIKDLSISFGRILDTKCQDMSIFRRTKVLCSLHGKLRRIGCACFRIQRIPLEDLGI